MLDLLPPQHQTTDLCSTSPTLKMHIRRSSTSTGDDELDIWGIPRKPVYYESFSFNTELEFQAEALVEDEFRVFSPPLWKSYHESRPLLPQNHQYSNLSLVSRSRAITDGRRELMKMIENMPESSYELSLKDIVDAQTGLQDGDGEKESRVVTKESSDFKGETQITKLKNTKNGATKRGQITRTSSMESETFLIKMFFPTSLSFKKKAKTGSSGRLASLKSPERFENGTEKDRWMKWFFVTRRSKSICRSSTIGNNNSSRYGCENNFVPGCWSFFPSKKNRTMRDKSCIF